MSQIDLRRVALRLVKWAESDPSDMFYENIREGEAVEMARLYLAEHPADDGEAITEDWAMAMGLVSDSGEAIDFAESFEAFFQMPRGVPDGTLVNRTRGEVRRLCAALKIQFPKGEK